MRTSINRLSAIARPGRVERGLDKNPFGRFWFRSAWASALLLAVAVSRAASDTTTSLGDFGGEGAGPFGGLVQSAEANPFSGSSTLSVPILVPPGRKNVTPALKLVYSSGSGDGPFGQGWSLPLGSIERSTKHGVPRCLGGHEFDFVLNLGGSALELVRLTTGSNSYRALVDDSYLEATTNPSQDTWEVATRAGMIYRFGTDPSARLSTVPDLPPSSPCSFTSVWALNQIQDPTGNTIDISYVKLEANGALYPSEILYGGNATTAHAFKVSFETIARAGAGFSSTTSFRRGVEERLNHVVQFVRAWYKPTATASFTLVRSYELRYQSSGAGGRTLLYEVQGDLLPLQRFEYSSGSFGHGATAAQQTTYSPPDNRKNLRDIDSGGDIMRSMMDMNGDGITDLVQAEDQSGSTWKVYFGTRTGLPTSSDPWDIPGPLPGEEMRKTNGSEVNHTQKETVDLTGDGVADFVDGTTWTSNFPYWKVYPGVCSAFDDCGFNANPINWSAPEEFVRRDREIGGANHNEKRLIDFNGDGRLDLLISSPPSWWVLYLNTGSGFETSPAQDVAINLTGRLSQGDKCCGNEESTTEDLFDFNGDGLPDFITSSSPGIGVCFNTGRDFNLADCQISPVLYGETAIRMIDRDDLKTYVDFLDVNGDGLPDRVYYGHAGQTWTVQLNLGMKLESVERTWPGPSPGSAHGPIRDTTDRGLTKVDVIDWNGDGFLDRIDATNLPWQILLGAPASGASVRPYLLVRAHNGLRGITDLRYGPSTDFDNSGEDAGAPDSVPELPFVQWVTTGIRRTDGLCDPPGGGTDLFNPTQNPCIGSGHELIKTIAYEGGRFDPVSREFRGFRVVEETDPDGNSRVTAFNQEDYTRGKKEFEELYAASRLVRKESFLWDEVSTYAPRHQVYLAEHRTLVADADYSGSDPEDDPNKQCLTTRNEVPDEFGRLLETCSLSCDPTPDVAEDCSNPPAGQVTTLATWVSPLGTQVRERPRSVRTEYQTPSSGLVTVLEKEFRYDGLSPGFAAFGSLSHVTSTVGTSFTGDNAPAVVNLTHDEQNGNLLSVTDPNGNPPSQNTYNPNLFSLYPTEERRPQTGSALHVTQVVTDLRFGKPTQITGENGELTRYQHDGLGRLECEALPGDTLSGCKGGGAFERTSEYYYFYPSPTATGYEARHSHVEIREREPDASSGYVVTKRYFDALGRARFTTTQRVINCESSPSTVVTNQTVYDRGGRVVKVFSAYEKAGAIVENPGGSWTIYDYDLNGQGVTDPLGRAHRVTPPDGNAVTARYKGIWTYLKDPLLNEVRVREDAFGRVALKELYDQSTKKLWFSYSYDGLGRMRTTRVSGDTSTTVTNSYDTMGRRIQVIDPDSGTWKYGYDKNGNVVYEDDPKTGQHVQWCHDELDRTVVRCTYPNDGYVSNACQPTSPCAGGAVESTYVYDQTEGGTNEGLGRLTNVTDPSGSEHFVYDERGRLTQQRKRIGTIEATTGFTYNAADRLVHLYYPDQEQIDHHYDDVGNLTSIRGPLGPFEVVDDACYDVYGRPATIQHGNGVDDEFFYLGSSENFRLDWLRTRRPSDGATYLSLKYQYDDRGKIDGIDDLLTYANPNLSNDYDFSYDGLGRLTMANWLPDDTYDETFDYDVLGNLSLKGGNVLNYTQKPHQVDEWGSKRMYYDANGRRDLKENSDHTDKEDYSYDALDRLTSVQLGSGSTVTQTFMYGYDHAGDRVSKSVDDAQRRFFNRYAESRPGVLIKYYYAGDRLVAAKAVSNGQFSEIAPGNRGASEPLRLPPAALAVIAFLILVLLVGPGRREVRIGVAVGPSRALGMAVAVLLASAAPFLLAPQCGPPPGGGGAVVRHYHLDHLGSTQATTDSSGNLVLQMRYRAYGEIRGEFGPDGGAPPAGEDPRFEFTGYETEYESLQYARARYYDPEIGQFLTHDPMGELASPYAYTAGDPINQTDPSGMCVDGVTTVGCVLAAIGKAVLDVALVAVAGYAVYQGVQAVANADASANSATNVTTSALSEGAGPLEVVSRNPGLIVSARAAQQISAGLEGEGGIDPGAATTAASLVRMANGKIWDEREGPMEAEAIPWPLVFGQADGPSPVLDAILWTIYLALLLRPAFENGQILKQQSGEGGGEGAAPDVPPYNEDPTAPPGEDFEWRGPPGSTPGSSKGGWFEKGTGTSVRPHREPNVHGPHNDISVRGDKGPGWRQYPDGSIEQKR